MCPGKDMVTGSGGAVLGTRGRGQEEFNLTQAQARLQVFIFYPSDWEDDSLSLLTTFSSIHPQFLATQCCLYGCSTDSVQNHLSWIKAEFGCDLAFPLLSDMTGQLGDRYSLFDKEEGINMRGVIITDSKGKELEVINSSLESGELAQYVLNIVMQACEAPKEVGRTGRVGREEGKIVENKAKNSEIQEPRAPSSNTRVGCRSLDTIWSQVVDKAAPVIETKRPAPGRVWGQAGGQSSDRASSTGGRERAAQAPKSVKIWTPPSAKPGVEQNSDNEGPKPRPKPTKTWGAPPAPSCPACGRAVYPVEQVFAADRSKFHKTCIQCQARGCQNKLTARGMHRVDGLRVCARCYAGRDMGEKVAIPSQKVETPEETRQREAKETREKKMNQEAMMELKAVMESGAKPCESRST